MYKLIKSLGFMAVLLGISLVSCEEDYPKSHIASFDTELFAVSSCGRLTAEVFVLSVLIVIEFLLQQYLLDLLV